MKDSDKILSAAVGLVAFIALLVFVSIAAAQVIVAEYVGISGYPRITLYDAPCAGTAHDAVVQYVRPEYHKRFKGGTSQFLLRSGAVRTYSACWARMDPPEALEAAYVVLFEDHDYTIIPVREFVDRRTRRVM